MHFDPSTFSAEMPALSRRFFEIVGEDVWLKRFTGLSQNVAKNELLRPYIHEYNYLELAFADFIRRQNEPVGTEEKIVDDLAFYRFCAFISQVARVHQRLSPLGKKNLAGSIRRGLRDNLISLEHEMSASTHLMQRGFDVEFMDLESASEEPLYDFIARKDGLEIEIECKSFSGDLGRKVHRESAAWILDACNASIRQVLKKSTKPLFLVEAEFIETVVSQKDYGRLISGLIDQLEFGNNETVSNSGVSVTLKHWDQFDLNSGYFDATTMTSEGWKRALEPYAGYLNNHCAFVADRLVPGTPPKQIGGLVLKGAKTDTVIDSIIKKGKQAAKQFSGSRPGIIYGQLIDVPTEALASIVQLQDVARNQIAEDHEAVKFPKIQLATNKMFASDKRSHVHSIAFRARGKLTETTAANINRPMSKSETDSVLVYRNPNSELVNDPRLNVFGVPYPIL